MLMAASAHLHELAHTTPSLQYQAFPACQIVAVCRKTRTDRSSHLVDGDLVVPMEDIGETYLRLANNKRVGRAVKAGAQ